MTFLPPALGPAALLRRKFVLRRKTNCAGAALPTPSIEIPKGEGRLRRPNPTKKASAFADAFFVGARGGSRTRTPLRALAPEASESTNSTTRASGCTHQREIYITMDPPFCQHFFTDLYTAFSLDKIGKGHYNKQAVT